MTLNEALDILEINGFLVESPNIAVLKGGIGSEFGSNIDDTYTVFHDFEKQGNALIRDGQDPELAKYNDIWSEFKDVAYSNQKYYIKLLHLHYNMSKDDARSALIKIIKNPEIIKKSPSMWDKVKTNLGLNQNLKEDFSIGVGAPCGCDQGIPHGGDCKGVAPVRMGLYQRSPFNTNPFYNGVPDAHHPDYWLKQIPKKKKKKKKVRKYSEN